MIGCISIKMSVFLKLIIFCIFFINFTDIHAQVTNKEELSRHEQTRNKANQNTVTIVTGGGYGAHINIANDLKDILTKRIEGNQELRVLPVLGEGGMQNVLDVLYLKGVDMAIVQSDALAHMLGVNPVLYKNIYQRINYISKLYNSEWHLISNKSIKDLKSLNGKTVNISNVNSGTYITSKTIFELLGFKINYTNYSDSVALQKLQAGKIDAVALLTGAPATIVQTIPRESDLHFIPVNFFFQNEFEVPYKDTLESLYLPTRLSHEQYPNLIAPGQNISTVSSAMVLAVYNWPEKSKRYKRVSRFVEALFGKIKYFHESGRHPKWKEVNLMANVSGWKRFPASVLARSNFSRNNNQTNTPESNIGKSRKELFSSFTDFVSQRVDANAFSRLSPAEREKLFREFSTWERRNRAN